MKIKFIFLILTIFLIRTVEAKLISVPPHNKNFLLNLDEQKIIAPTVQQKEFIIKFIQSFDQNQYKIYSVSDIGLFFLDASDKPDGIKDILRHDIIWEKYIVDLIKKYAKDKTTVLDVGAHIGTHTLTMGKSVVNGKVIAFEPQPKTCRENAMNAALNGMTNIYTFWAAVGDENGEIDLPNFIPSCEIVQLHDHEQGLSGIKAPLITLDSLSLTNISLMKVDVDGWESKFLDGAKETIIKNKPIIIIEIEGGYDIESPNCDPEVIKRAKNTKLKIARLGYKIKKIGISDYLAIPKKKKTIK